MVDPQKAAFNSQAGKFRRNYVSGSQSALSAWRPETMGARCVTASRGGALGLSGWRREARCTGAPRWPKATRVKFRAFAKLGLQLRDEAIGAGETFFELTRWPPAPPAHGPACAAGNRLSG
jgi:hypothetical protein